MGRKADLDAEAKRKNFLLGSCLESKPRPVYSLHRLSYHGYQFKSNNQLIDQSVNPQYKTCFIIKRCRFNCHIRQCHSTCGPRIVVGQEHIYDCNLRRPFLLPQLSKLLFYN